MNIVTELVHQSALMKNKLNSPSLYMILLESFSVA